MNSRGPFQTAGKVGKKRKAARENRIKKRVPGIGSKSTTGIFIQSGPHEIGPKAATGNRIKSGRRVSGINRATWNWTKRRTRLIGLDE